MGIGTILAGFDNLIAPWLGAFADFQARAAASRQNESHNQSAIDVSNVARYGSFEDVRDEQGNVTGRRRVDASQPDVIRGIRDTESTARQGALAEKRGTVGTAIGDYKRAVTGENSMEARTGRAQKPYLEDIARFSDEYTKGQGAIADERVAAVKDMMGFIADKTRTALETNPALLQINEDRNYFKDQFGELKATTLGDIPRTRADLDNAIADITFHGEQDVLKAGDAPSASFKQTKSLLDQQLMAKQITPMQYQQALEEAKTSKQNAIGDSRRAITESNRASYNTARLGAEAKFMDYKNNIFNTITSALSSTTSGVTALDAQAAGLSSEVMRVWSEMGGKAVDQVGAANDIKAAAGRDVYNTKVGTRSAAYDDIVKAINTDGAIAGQIADLTIQNAKEDLSFNADTFARATATSLEAVDNDKYWATIQTNIHKDWDIMVPQIMDLIGQVGQMSTNQQTLRNNERALDIAESGARNQAIAGYTQAGASLAAPFVTAGLGGAAGATSGTAGSLFKGSMGR